MIKIYFLSASIALYFCACNQKKVPSESEENVPAALQEKSVSGEIFTKRDNDVVGNLYKDLVDTTPLLKEFERTLKLLSEERSDSIAAYQGFNTKNNSYYFSADSYIKSIQDSLLRYKIRLLINNSMETYTALTAEHEQLLSSTDIKSANLNDLHLILKLVKTLPLIEKYQKLNLPSSAGLKKVEKKYLTTIRRADSLIAK